MSYETPVSTVRGRGEPRSLLGRTRPGPGARTRTRPKHGRRLASSRLPGRGESGLAPRSLGASLSLGMVMCVCRRVCWPGEGSAESWRGVCGASTGGFHEGSRRVRLAGARVGPGHGCPRD